MQILNYLVYSGPVTREVDATGALYIAGLFYYLDGSSKRDFGFHIWRRVGDGAWENVPTQIKCNGHGTINRDGHWIAINGNGVEMDTIPGFVPVVAVAPQASVAGELVGVWQHEPNSIEMGDASAPHAYIDLSAAGDPSADYGFRIIRRGGTTQIGGSGPIVIVVDGREVQRFG